MNFILKLLRGPATPSDHLCVSLVMHSTTWKRNPCRAEVGWAMEKRFLPLGLCLEIISQPHSFSDSLSHRLAGLLEYEVVPVIAEMCSF